MSFGGFLKVFVSYQEWSDANTDKVGFQWVSCVWRKVMFSYDGKGGSSDCTGNMLSNRMASINGEKV